MGWFQRSWSSCITEVREQANVHCKHVDVENDGVIVVLSLLHAMLTTGLQLI